MKPLEIVGLIVGLVGVGIGAYALLRQNAPATINGAPVGAPAGAPVADTTGGVPVKPAAALPDVSVQLKDVAGGIGDAINGIGQMLQQGQGLVDSFTGWFGV